MFINALFLFYKLAIEHWITIFTAEAELIFMVYKFNENLKCKSHSNMKCKYFLRRVIFNTNIHLKSSLLQTNNSWQQKSIEIRMVLFWAFTFLWLFSDCYRSTKSGQQSKSLLSLYGVSCITMTKNKFRYYYNLLENIIVV